MTAAATAYRDFLHDADPAARRAELTAFFGPNAHRFLPVYDRMREDAVAAGGGRARFRLGGGGFSVPAFLCGPVWFFYRKMWVVAGIVTALMVGLALIPGTTRAGLPAGIALGLLAYRTYVQHSIAALQKLRRPDGTIDPADLHRAGGVSRTAGWISGLVYAALTLVSVAAIILLIRMGEPIPR